MIYANQIICSYIDAVSEYTEPLDPAEPFCNGGYIDHQTTEHLQHRKRNFTIQQGNGAASSNNRQIVNE